jgi:hypothetical protein
LLAQPGVERLAENPFIAWVIPWDAGVIFQLQHLLDHAHSIRRTFSLVILVPHGKASLGLARLAHLKDVPLTVF